MYSYLIWTTCSQLFQITNDNKPKKKIEQDYFDIDGTQTGTAILSQS